MRKRYYEEIVKKYEESLKVYEECMKKQEEEIKQLKESINEIKKKEIEKSIWKPKFGGEYWYASFDMCDVYRDVWRGFDIDEKRLNIGNMYSTKEEAQYQLERMNVLGELNKFSCKFRNNGLNYYIYLNSDTNELGVVLSNIYMRFDFYFESYKKAEEAIEVVGEDRIKKYLFEVE